MNLFLSVILIYEIYLMKTTQVANSLFIQYRHEKFIITAGTEPEMTSEFSYTSFYRSKIIYIKCKIICLNFFLLYDNLWHITSLSNVQESVKRWCILPRLFLVSNTIIEDKCCSWLSQLPTRRCCWFKMVNTNFIAHDKFIKERTSHNSFSARFNFWKKLNCNQCEF